MKRFGYPRVIMKLAVVLLLILGIFELRNIGFEAKAIISGSMEPAYPVGSIVLIKDTLFSDIKVGDVITYKMGTDMNVTHRVEAVDQENESLITKGDANEVIDPGTIEKENIVGKVFGCVPYLGYITLFLQTNQGRLVSIMCIIVLILLSIILGAVKRKSQACSKNVGELGGR